MPTCSESEEDSKELCETEHGSSVLEQKLITSSE